MSISAKRGDSSRSQLWVGHADEVGDPLPLDQLEGPLGVPLVHHHELQAAGEARQHHRHAAGHVEQRHDEDERRAARPARRSSGRRSWSSGGLAAEGHERLDDGPVGRHRALRAAGGARRVEDRGVVVRRRRRRRASARRGRARPPSGRRRRAPRRRGTDEDPARRAAPPTARARSTRSTSAISTVGAAVLEGVVELVLGPPRVERHRDGADRRDGGEARSPTRGSCACRWRPGRRAARRSARRAARPRASTWRITSAKRPALVLVDEEDRRRPGPGRWRTARAGSAGACLNTLVGTPSTSITSISNRSPGAVTAAAASS